MYTHHESNQELVKRAIKKAKEIGLIKIGDYVVVVFGARERVSGSINSMTVVQVSSE